MCTGMLPFRGDTSGVIFDAILSLPPLKNKTKNPGGAKKKKKGEERDKMVED